MSQEGASSENTSYEFNSFSLAEVRQILHEPNTSKSSGGLLIKWFLFGKFLNFLIVCADILGHIEDQLQESDLCRTTNNSNNLNW